MLSRSLNIFQTLEEVRHGCPFEVEASRSRDDWSQVPVHRAQRLAVLSPDDQIDRLVVGLRLISSRASLSRRIPAQ